MTLMLHVNAKAVDYDGLRQLDTPTGDAKPCTDPAFSGG